MYRRDEPLWEHEQSSQYVASSIVYLQSPSLVVYEEKVHDDAVVDFRS